MAKRGRYFAVCCIDDSATKHVDEFLTSTYANKDGNPALAVISKLDEKYTEPTQPPVDTFTTPFVKKSASECSKLIREMTGKNKSDLNYEYLVILDERSSKDQTALVVNSFDPDVEPISLRAAFEIVNIIMLAMVSKGTMREYKEIADGKPDGVLRF